MSQCEPQVSIPEDWIGKPVEVKFLDHVQIEGGTTLDLARVVALGQLTKIDPESIVIFAWTTDKDQDQECDNTRLAFRIIRSTIQEITRLEPKETRHV